MGTGETMRRTICTTLSLCGRPKEGSRFLDRRVPTRSKPFALAVAAALGAVAPFAVLGNETVTNTGPTVLRGDLGVYDGTAITGFFGTVENDGPGIVIGAIHQPMQSHRRLRPMRPPSSIP